MNVFKLKKFARSDFNYFNNLNLMSEVSLVSACLNEFSFRTEEEKRGEIVIYLELFMCTEHTGEFLKYHYDELEKNIKKYETIDNKDISNEVNKSTKEDIETLNLKKMSFLLKETNDSIISAIQSNPKVHGVEMAKNGRFNLRIDNFDDDAVNDVLKDIIRAGGVVKSIFTQEPSLEDVFIKATAEVNEDDRA